jgi:hypothetical protein
MADPTYVQNAYALSWAPPNAGDIAQFLATTPAAASIVSQLLADMLGGRALKLSAYGTGLQTIFTPAVSRTTWTTLTAYTTSQYVVPTVANGFYYKCTAAGTAAAGQPTWPTTLGATVTDGTVTWTCWGPTAAPAGVTF